MTIEAARAAEDGQHAPHRLQALAAEALARDPAAPIMEFEGRWFTWGEFRRIADQIADIVEASGAPSQAAVALVARNHPGVVAALLELIRQGRVIQMVYAFQSGPALARDIRRLAPAIVIAAAEDYSPELRAALEDCKIAGVSVTMTDAVAAPGLERSAGGANTALHKTPCIEVLTSGTTGPPKQFPVSYDLIDKHIVGKNLVYRDGDDQSREPPMLLFKTLGNISGLYTFVPALLNGRRSVMVDRFTLESWRDHVARFKPKFVGIPPIAAQMILDADMPAAEFDGVLAFTTGSAPLDPTVQRNFEDRYGKPLLSSYGATEFAGPVSSMTLEDRLKFGAEKRESVGRPFAGAQLRIIHPETGAVLAAGQEGLLEVIAPRIGPDWIRTADLAVIDADGFLYIKGRVDGAIMRGGFKLLPETIERALVSHPAIAAAAVVGVPDRRLGQVPAAAVQVKAGVPRPSIAELEKHLRERVLATHIPVHWKFVDALPQTASAKVHKAGVAALFAPEADSSA